MDGLNKHLASNHFKAFGKATESLAEDMDINVFKAEPFDLYE